MEEVYKPTFTEETVKNVPVYRFLVLLGHEFQNFPSEVSKVFKIRSPTDRNIVKWLLQGRKPMAHQVVVQKQKTIPSN